MKKEEVLKYVEEKPEATFVIRTEDEHNTFIENYKKEIEETVIPGKVAEMHNRYDEDIFAVTGKRKPPEKKTYEFNKEILSELTNKASLADKLAKEKADLEMRLKDGHTDQKTLADLEQVRKDYAALQQEKESQIGTLQKEYQQFKVKSMINGALSGMMFNDKIPESALRALTDSTIDDLSRSAEMRDGQLVFLDKDGNPLRNKNNALNPYTAKELLTERLKDVIQVGKKASGPNVSDEILKETDASGKLIKIALVVPDSIKTRMALGDYLVGKGILRNTPEFDLAYREYGANLPVR